MPDLVRFAWRVSCCFQSAGTIPPACLSIGACVLGEIIYQRLEEAVSLFLAGGGSVVTPYTWFRLRDRVSAVCSKKVQNKHALL